VGNRPVKFPQHRYGLELWRVLLLDCDPLEMLTVLQFRTRKGIFMALCCIQTYNFLNSIANYDLRFHWHYYLY